MTADEIYKAILASITKVRDVARSTHFNSDPLASGRLLDEMARNAAQNIVLMLDVGDKCAYCERPIPDHTFCGCVEPRTVQR